MKPIIKRNLFAICIVIMILAACLFVEWAAFHVPVILFVIGIYALILFAATEKGFKNGK